MTSSNLVSSTTQANPQTSRGRWVFVDKLPGAKLLRNLSIGGKLNIGFGILVALTLVGASVSYWASVEATTNINRTEDLRVPTALASSKAQTDLLKMLGDVRGYLALGEGEFRNSYKQARQAFEADLAELERLSSNFNPDSKRRLEELKITFAEWSQLPEQLFELRDDQLEREPAYRILATEGIRNGGRVLIDLQSMIEAQAQREPSAQNVELLEDMAKFQGSFTAMLSGLRGYVTTRNRIYRQEYEVNLEANQFAWEALNKKRNFLTSNQQTKLDSIAQNRETFLTLPDQMFEVLEGERWREDLFLFTTEAVPLAGEMQQLLAEMTADQQALLKADLNRGRQGLAIANQRTLVAGIVALILGLTMAIVFRENIAGPVGRLTDVAERIRTGDLVAQARVESGDEIGILAETFNNMTSQLRQTLLQVRKEKKRADDLLNVVIPIGVELSSEKDFNRLLENMLLEAKAFCHADAGILYLKEANRLKFVIVRNDTLNIAMGGTVGKDVTFSRLPMMLPVYDDEATQQDNRQSIAAHVAQIGTAINIPDAYQEDVLDTYGPGIFDEKSDYRSVSYLTIPLKNSQDEVLGVLQLINAEDPETSQIIPFDQNLQQMMESFSSLAVAALEAYIREQSLRQEIQQLRIEVDEAKRQQQVSEIVETDFFQDLQSKARNIRRRKRRWSSAKESDETPSAPDDKET